MAALVTKMQFVPTKTDRTLALVKTGLQEVG